MQNHTTDPNQLVAHLFRHQSARIVATLVRVFGSSQLDLAEDVVQDALLKALRQWPFRGIPENPAAWLTLVAKNRALDLLRRDTNLTHKITELERALPYPQTTPTPLIEAEMDDQLALIMMCCHPNLSVEYQIALTLKSACGFSTGEIARAFLAPPSTIAQRIVRAKRLIRSRTIVIEPPSTDDLHVRVDSVLQVVYLLFNEGYQASVGADLVRTELCDEAIRLGLLIAQHPRIKLPAAHALVSLMMLQAARLPARSQNDGSLTVLAEQDRSLWDQKLIAQGLRHLGWSAAGDKVTSYHLQAEIAAIHATAPTESGTNWAQIVQLYEDLYQLETTPVVLLNRAIAISRWKGAEVGLAALKEFESHEALQNYHLLPAVKAELLRQVGHYDQAAAAYRRALECLCTDPERRFLEMQLSQVERQSAVD